MLGHTAAQVLARVSYRSSTPEVRWRRIATLLGPISLSRTPTHTCILHRSGNDGGTLRHSLAHHPTAGTPVAARMRLENERLPRTHILPFLCCFSLPRCRRTACGDATDMLAITRDGAHTHTHMYTYTYRSADAAPHTHTRTSSDLLSNDYSERLLIRHAGWFSFPELHLR